MTAPPRSRRDGTVRGVEKASPCQALAEIFTTLANNILY